jgi:hypothetical protein
MDVDTFWSLVGRTRDEARAGDVAGEGGNVVERHVDTLTEALDDLPDEELQSFDRHFRQARAAAYRWDLWAAGYLALGGMSDDSFLDFRNWLITHGRPTYERVLADPDGVTDLTWDEDEDDFGAAESWSYVATELLEDRGLDLDEDEDEAADESGEPAGEPFPEDDDAWFAARFPRLWAKYGDAAD